MSLEDFRGIDVALLYQPKYLTVINSYPIHVPILNSKGEKIYTRQTLYVAGIMDGDTVHILVNHWYFPAAVDRHPTHLGYRQVSSIAL
jgi:hypothetical protein